MSFQPSRPVSGVGAADSSADPPATELLRDVSRSVRSLAGLAALTAILGFVATGLLLQLGRRTAAVTGDLAALVGVVGRSQTAMEAAFARIDGQISAQTAAVDRIAAVAGGAQASGERTFALLTGLSRSMAEQGELAGEIRRQLADAALERSNLRRAMDERFARERELAATEQAEMLAAVTAAMARVERVMTDQAAELHTRREDLDASARRLADVRRQALVEVTTAVGMNLEGLRQILDGLRQETLSAGAAPAAGVAAEVCTEAGAPAGTAATEEAAGGEKPTAPAVAPPEPDVSTTSATGNGRSTVPEVAGREQDHVVE